MTILGLKGKLQKRRSGKAVAAVPTRESSFAGDGINAGMTSSRRLPSVYRATHLTFPAYDNSQALPNTPNAVHKHVQRQDDTYQSFVLQPFPQASASSSSSAPIVSTVSDASVCPQGNGTTFTSAAGTQYQVLCDIDFTDNDYPFQLVTSYQACVQQCDSFSAANTGTKCLAALYVPSRRLFSNDCYLKSSLSNPKMSNLGIQGAVVVQSSATNAASTSSAVLLNRPSATQTTASSSSTVGASSASSPTSSSVASPASSSAVPPMSSSASSSAPASQPSNVGSGPGITYANGKSVIVPQISGSRLHGPTANAPTKQYVKTQEPNAITLARSLLTIGVNGDLTTGYGLSPLTGSLQVNLTTQPYLQPLRQTPHLSRDGGRGGYVNGQHLFIFCDTGTYSPPGQNTNGQFLGFVSSSCATDVGMNGLNGQPLNLQDGIGEWSDDAGRQRGFAQLTDGELAYNLAQQGYGQRYAVWPESSIIPLDGQSGIMYAPIVYDNVNRATQAAIFTYSGATLLTITAGGRGGPVAQRTVARLFNQDEVEWGCAGGIRSWGPSGIGGEDGLVYIFGNINGGILAGRVQPGQINNRASVSVSCISRFCSH